MSECAWMDKAIDPPPTDPDARIIVWGIDWPAGAVICLRDGLGWSDVVDHVEVYFRYLDACTGSAGMTDQTPCPTCGSDCNERDELIKAEREIERLQDLIDSQAEMITNNRADISRGKEKLEHLQFVARQVLWDMSSKALLIEWITLLDDAINGGE